jgi:thioredoxin 1
MIMKKHLYILSLLLLLSLNACSNAHGDKTSGTDPESLTLNNDGMVVKLTAESFKKLVWDYEKYPKDWKFNGDLPCLVDFYADWCRPCKMVAPIMDELAKEYKGKIRIYKVNTDEQRELSGIFQVRSIPTMLFVPKSGQPQISVGALSKDDYVKVINSILTIK